MGSARAWHYCDVCPHTACGQLSLRHTNSLGRGGEGSSKHRLAASLPCYPLSPSPPLPHPDLCESRVRTFLYKMSGYLGQHRSETVAPCRAGAKAAEASAGDGATSERSRTASASRISDRQPGMRGKGGGWERA